MNMEFESIGLQPIEEKDKIYDNEKKFPDLDVDVQKIIDDLAQEKGQILSEEESVSLVSQVNDLMIQSGLWRKESVRVFATPESIQLLDAVLKHIVDRIKKETDVEKELQGVVELDGLVNFRDYIGNMPRVRTKKDNKSSRNAGEYSYFLGKAKVNLSPESDNPFNVISALARKGSMRDFSVLFHELIHSKQRNKSKNIFRQLELLSFFIATGVSEAFEVPATFEYGVVAYALIASWRVYKTEKVKKPLKEMHAYQSAEQTFGSDDSLDSSIGIAETLRAEYGLKSKKDIDRIITASQQLNQLKTLGFSHEEIGKLIQVAKWDNKKVQYDTLQSAIDMKKIERGLEDEDLDTLADINRIKRKTTKLRMQRIAQEEVKRLVGLLGKYVNEKELQK